MLETPSLLQLQLEKMDTNRSSEEPSGENEDSEAGTSSVKTEPADSLLFDTLMSQENTEPQDSSNGEVATPKNEKPNWFPSRSSRSIVWDHISWIESTQRAACNYCSAEFQIKGGTSAVLRHLKTIHPQNIDFDPTLEPVRKRKKKAEDNVVVLNEDSSYMDSLLKQFWPNGEMNGLNVESENGEGEAKNELELNEVIKSLQQQDNQMNLEPTASSSTESSNTTTTTTTTTDSERDIRKILGILDEQPVVEDIGVGSASASSSSPQPTTNGTTLNKQQVNGKHGKFSLALLSSIKRAGEQPTMKDNLPPAPPPQNGTKLEYESRVLYNQSLHSTIVRENAMTNYYNLKSRYLQLSIQKLEKELQDQ